MNMEYVHLREVLVVYGVDNPSHVLLAIGAAYSLAYGSLRITIGEDNTKEDIDFLVEKLEEIIPRLRGM